MTNSHLPKTHIMGIAERKEREKEQRRQAIIAAAEQVFFSRGFDESTMDDVAVQAELSKGTLYLYFNSKIELHWEIMKKGMAILSEMILKSISTDANALDNLRKMGEVFYRFSSEEPMYFNSMMFFEGKDLELLHFEQKELDSSFQTSPIKILYEVIESGIIDGSVRNDFSVPAMANTLWAQTLGVLQVIRNKKEVFELFQLSGQEVIQCHYELVLNGVKGKTTGS